jgi:outer membrane protein TolC
MKLSCELKSVAGYLVCGAALLFGCRVSLAAQTLTLEDAVAHAQASNPGLSVIQARAQALAALPLQRGTLPDPRLALNAQNLPLDTFSLSQEAMTQIQVGISQTLPFPGKLALQQQAAQLQADAAGKAVDELRLQLSKDVKTIWWNLFYLDRALEAVHGNEALLQQVISVAQTKYEVGQGGQQDVLLAQLEHSKLQLEQTRLQGMRRKEEARLNTLLGRATDTAVRLPEVQDNLLPVLSSGEQELLQLALQQRPGLSAQQNQIDSARSQIDLAKKDYYPDYSIAAIYGFRSGNNPDGSERPDMASVLFSMNLPIYTSSRQKSVVDQRTNEWLQQKYMLDDSRNQIAGEISNALAGYRQADEQVRLFQTNVLPQARQTVESMLAGYQVNKVDFLSLIRSQTSLYEYENQYWKAFSAANQALAQLVAAVGKENIYE